MRTVLGLALFLILVASCKDDEIKADNTPSSIHTAWINPEYLDNTITFKKSTELSTDSYGIKFLTDGSVIEHKNAGFCGTPPITYDYFYGEYNYNEGMINMTVPFWGGSIDIVWEVLNLSNTTLVVKVIDQVYHENY